MQANGIYVLFGGCFANDGAVMKKSVALIWAIAAFGFVNAASAADMPVKAVGAPSVAPAFNWTGFYVGGTVGGAWLSNTGTWNPLPSPVAFNANTTSGDINWTAFIGGGHVGYNWQFAPTWLAGIEGDFSGVGGSGSSTQTWTFFGTSTPVAGSLIHMTSKLDWLASLRGRLGYLVMPNLLGYVTGGVAWARFDYSANNLNGGYATSAAFSQTQTGFAVGGGLEWAWTKNWLLRGEYLYYQFNNGPSIVAAAAGFPTFPSNFVWSRTQVNVARLGLSYKF